MVNIQRRLSSRPLQIPISDSHCLFDTHENTSMLSLPSNCKTRMNNRLNVIGSTVISIWNLVRKKIISFLVLNNIKILFTMLWRCSQPSAQHINSCKVNNFNFPFRSFHYVVRNKCAWRGTVLEFKTICSNLLNATLNSSSPSQHRRQK